MRMLRSGDLKGAEKKFEQLILAEPEHHDGYEGLALVCRSKEKKEEALLLIEHALNLARDFLRREPWIKKFWMRWRRRRERS
jgi:tetratricopeptide (TPR) repeat protein